MTSAAYRLHFKPTKAERNSHVARMQATARSIAVALEAGMPLVDWEQDLLQFIRRDTKATTDDHAAIARQWANDFAPSKKLPHYPHTDAAMAYALMRQRKESHYAAMLVLTHELGVTERALEKAIWPLLPDVCAHLGQDVDSIRWRSDPPPK